MLYTKNVNLTDTSTQTLVTIPSGYVAHWTMAFISNLHNSTNDIILFIDKTPDPDVYIFNGTSVQSKEYLLLDGNAVFVLQPGDVIKAAAGGSGNIEVVVTFDLLEAPATFVNFSGA